MNTKAEKFEARVIIHADNSTIEQILNYISKKYDKNSIKYYIEKPLSKREIEIMKLVILGCNNTEIAQNLHITRNTVKAHLSNIFEKLAVKDRVQAAVKVTMQNLLNIRG